MKFYFWVISAFLILFYPRQLTHLICFGRHRDQNNVKSKAVYWGIYLFWTIFFLIGCMMMGSAAKVSTAMDKVVYFFILGSDSRDCVRLASEETDEEYISSYYTREDIDESFLLKMIQEHESIYDLCGSQELTIKKTYKNNWTIYLNNERMGYARVKKRFFMTEIRYEWDRQKIDKRRSLYVEKYM